jgi:hypothetical protein
MHTRKQEKKRWEVYFLPIIDKEYNNLYRAFGSMSRLLAKKMQWGRDTPLQYTQLIWNLSIVTSQHNLTIDRAAGQQFLRLSSLA